MDVSIIVCTRDRRDNLVVTLERIGQAHVPAGWEVELLVVDNGSTDGTGAFLKSLQLPNMRVRHVLEPRKGKGYAYNAGIEAARGRIFLFTDDDVQVPQDWIEGMCGPIKNGVADAVQGGIKIAPHLDRPWLTGALRVWVASVEDPVNPPEGLVGANMAFGRQAVAVTGGFDPRLGPGAAGFFDDTVFGWAIQGAGQKIAYRPHIQVEHHFMADRLALSAFLQTARRMAASYAIVQRDLDPSKARPSVTALLKQLPGLAARSVTQIIRFGINRQPDPGYVVRYYQFCLWRALRRAHDVPR